MFPWWTMIRIAVVAALSLFFLGFLAGCQVSAMPNDFAAAFRQTSTAIVTQTDWDSVLAQVDGQVHDPGVVLRAGIIYELQAHLKGVNGGVAISGTGAGGATIDPVIRDALIELGVPPETIDQAIMAALQAALARGTADNGPVVEGGAPPE